MDIKKIWNQHLGEQRGYLQDAREIALLTSPSLDPDPQYDTRSSNNAGQPRKLQRPYTDAGARSLKTLASTLASTLSPPNIRFFRLQTDPNLITGAEQPVIDIINEEFVNQEKTIDQFLAQFNFNSFSSTSIERNLVEGTTAVKVDKDKGFMLYPLRSLVVCRSFGTLIYAVFQEEIQIKDPDPNMKGQYKTSYQYIYVNYQDDEVWTQTEIDKEAQKTDEKSKQYIPFCSEIPTNENFSRSFYSDHFGLLNSINESGKALIEAQKNCSWNFLTYTGPESIPVSRIAAVKSGEVIRMPSHDVLQWQGPGRDGKISDWAFVSDFLATQIESLQHLSAAGLISRAKSIQTATEVNAILTELQAIVGSVAQTYSETLYKPVIEAVIIVLGLREKIEASLNAANLNVSKETLNKLMQTVVVSGVPAMAREQDSTRMIMGIQSLSSTFGPEVVNPLFNVREVSKEYLDGLRVNTDKIMNKEEAYAIPPEILASLPPQVQQLPPDQILVYLQQLQNQSQPQTGAA